MTIRNLANSVEGEKRIKTELMMMVPGYIPLQHDTDVTPEGSVVKMGMLPYLQARSLW